MAFQPGQSGNPGGRPKTKPFADALRMELAAVGEDHKALRDIARKLINTALGDGKDSMPAIKEIADRMDGKPPQAIIGDSEADPVNVLQRIERVIVDPANKDG